MRPDTVHGLILILALGFMGLYVMALVPVIAYVILGGLFLYACAILVWGIGITIWFVICAIAYLCGNKKALDWAK